MKSHVDFIADAYAAELFRMNSSMQINTVAAPIQQPSRYRMDVLRNSAHADYGRWPLF